MNGEEVCVLCEQPTTEHVRQIVSGGLVTSCPNRNTAIAAPARPITEFCPDCGLSLVTFPSLILGDDEKITVERSFLVERSILMKKMSSETADFLVTCSGCEHEFLVRVPRG